MPVTVVRLTRSRNADGGLLVRLGVPLLDEYLEFLAGRCRPNTVLAVAYDLGTAERQAPGSGGVVALPMTSSGMGRHLGDGLSGRYWVLGFGQATGTDEMFGQGS